MNFSQLATALLVAASLLAQAPGGKARIAGAAHMAYYVSDLNRARAYYKDFLGFEEAFPLKNPDGSEHAAFVKINDRQYIELIAEAPKNHGFLLTKIGTASACSRKISALRTISGPFPGRISSGALGL